MIYIGLGRFLSFQTVKDGNIDIQTSKTKSTLPIPPLLEDKNPDPNIADFTLEPQEGETSFLPNTKTREFDSLNDTKVL